LILIIWVYFKNFGRNDVDFYWNLWYNVVKMNLLNVLFCVLGCQVDAFIVKLCLNHIK